MQGVGLAASFGIYPRRFGFAGPGISVRSAIMRSRERKRVMYKIEIMPGVTFTQNFSTVCEARIFMRDLNTAMNDLGLVPFKYEIVKITEGGLVSACNEEPGTADEEDAGRAMREVPEGGV